MDRITYSRLCFENFGEGSLKGFRRYQRVDKSWRFAGGEWTLVDNPYIEDWDEAKFRSEERRILEFSKNGGAAFGAFVEGQVAGFCTVSGKPLGSRGQYRELDVIQVSEPFRHCGIGKRLFALAQTAAKEMGAEALYISANSSRETQEFYRRVGCVNAAEIVPAIAENEPCDVQMTCALTPDFLIERKDNEYVFSRA